MNSDAAVGTTSRRKRRTSPFSFLFLNLVFHLVYISSIFDIYFTSPVVHPTPRYSVESTLDNICDAAAFDAPAKRLVLIVGDGLRADTLYKRHPSTLLPSWATLGESHDGNIAGEDSWNQIKTNPTRAALPFAQALNPSRADVKHAGRVPKSAFAGSYLRNVARHRGVWGISHTRVPTESRPGHVAMIAGMYEDVSAVTKGWKLNPIAFDSVLNQSSHSYAFGSPDIVPMFAVGAAAGRVDMWTYNDDEEDFTKDATKLDLWVLDRLKELFTRARKDKTLYNKMQKPGTVFFLHLLGLDTTGHFSRPLSPEYIGNTIVVDAITQKVEQMMDDFFGNDGRTAYIFTADHGMSHKGNHGDGNPDNTRTPIVAWGAGVRKPQAATAEQKRAAHIEREEDHDGYYDDWGMDDIARVDIDQADITPLMATLVGIPVPANSEGRLDVDILQVSPEHKARALFANALQVLETYRVKHQDRAERMLRFIPFHPLVEDNSIHQPGQSRVIAIQGQIKMGNYQEALDQSNKLIDLAIEGAHYLQTYDWLLLCSIVTIGYLGSIAYAVAFLLQDSMLPAVEETVSRDLNALPRPSKIKLLIAPVSAATFAAFSAQSMPVSYYLYAALAIFFWSRVAGELDTIKRAFSLSSGENHQSKSRVTLVLKGIGVVAVLELIVIGYLYRAAWFIGLLVLGFAWPAVALGNDFKSENEGILLLWGLACLATGSFTISDVNKEESISLLVLSACLFLAAGYIILTRLEAIFPASIKSQKENDTFVVAYAQHLSRTTAVLKVQLVVLVVTTITTVISARSLQQKNGLPGSTQVVAWICLLFCFTFPFAAGFRRPIGNVPQPQSQRLAIVVFAFAPVFVLLSLRDEVLFLGFYTVNLLVWAKLEGSIYESRVDTTKEKNSKRLLQLGDLRISIFFLFFLHVGFFGTGNVASISSFYLSPVYRLVPIFSPFLMAILLLVKILVPFIILNAVFQALCVTPPNLNAFRRPDSTGDNTAQPDRGLKLFGQTAPGGLGLQSSLSLIFGACIAADVLALNFLYAVKSQGSWLEIGQTITHFVMANLLQIFMLGLAALTSALFSTTQHVTR